jgi:cytochrome c biogenesis protein CcmG, thiol:disulfide interchange protein DsbE
MKVIAVLVASTFLLTSCGSEPPKSSSLGKVVSCSSIEINPNITEGTTLECLDSNSKVVIEAIKGPAIINVWGSWCAPCRQELPFLRELAATGKVQIIGIDVEEPNIETGRRFVVDQGMTWPNLYDRDGSTKSTFGLGVPITWYINSKSEVVYKHIGIVKSKEELFSDVEKYLGVKL